ncbi:toxin-antitoxin system YwqK family antitoxin [Flavobacterium inviolabile]|uniref:hypothetical protein n=1 Tax=Flavobacterium inviolabile TaxID=2748320 RepID=UPI0015B21FB6|nr:hypothetical protein [Flavobacterium inviolabile]
MKYQFSDNTGYSIVEYRIENGDTIADGKYSYYDNQNRLRKTGTFVDNEIYGTTKFYYENGNVESIHFIKDNKDIGEVTWNYPDGKIRKYSFYDVLGNLNFIANYDKEGTMETCKGLILFEIYQFMLRKQKKPKRYKIGDTVKYQFMFPNIPNTERKFHFELLDYDNSKIKRDVTKIEPVTLDVEEQAVKKGKNTIRAYIQYKFKDKRETVLSDTLSFDYHVE